MGINDLPGDILQRFFTLALNDLNLEKGCENMSGITRVCKHWREIFYERNEPIAAFYNRLFVRPLTLTSNQVLSNQQENAKQLNFLFRLSIGFYFHLPEQQRLYRGEKLIPLINQDLYEAVETKNPNPDNKESNLALVLTGSGNLLCMENVLKSGVLLTRSPFINDDGLSDEEIDLSIDLFLLTLKQISRKDFQNAKEMLSQVMRHPVFKHHQTTNFFDTVETLFFDHPSPERALIIWNLIKEIAPNSPMLNDKKFLSFYYRCYNQQEIDKRKVAVNIEQKREFLQNDSDSSSESIFADEDMMEYDVFGDSDEDDLSVSNFSDESFTQNPLSYESEDDIDIQEPPPKKFRHE